MRSAIRIFQNGGLYRDSIPTGQSVRASFGELFCSYQSEEMPLTMKKKLTIRHRISSTDVPSKNVWVRYKDETSPHMSPSTTARNNNGVLAGCLRDFTYRRVTKDKKFAGVPTKVMVPSTTALTMRGVLS
ncbi:uncharacterized protein LOC144867377 [Branchiostoma floridae x Branchiostoma japonicum]